MTDHAAFIRAICERPNDTTLRLVYADFLEERGDVRAEFIRVQCKLATLPEPVGFRQPTLMSDWDKRANRYDTLRRREAELLRANGLAWLGFRPITGRVMEESDISVGVGLTSKRAIDSEFRFRRGFVEKITCRLEDWIGEECEACAGDGFHDVAGNPWECKMCHGTGRTNAHGIEIVRAAPVREVRLNDCLAIGVEGVAAFRWQRREVANRELWMLPPPLFDSLLPDVNCTRLIDGNAIVLREYETEEHANQGLSRAAITWARHHAGLPKLEELATSPPAIPRTLPASSHPSSPRATPAASRPLRRRC